MFLRLKALAQSLIVYLGDSAHRRFVSLIVAMAATHVIGKALDADGVALLIEIIVGGIGGAWTGKAGDQ